MSELPSWLGAIISGFNQQSAIELMATLLALCYTALAIRHSLWCWPAALLSSVLTAHVMLDARLFNDAILQLYYAGMAVYGWWHWRQLAQQTPARHSSSAELASSPLQAGGRAQMQEWPWPQHLSLIVVTAAAGVLLGYLMATIWQADFPWLGAQLTCFAIVSTFLTARKVVSNWLYWVVIDAVSVYVYVSSGLYFFALLFVIYTAMATMGYLTWRRSFAQQRHQSGIFANA